MSLANESKKIKSSGTNESIYVIDCREPIDLKGCSFIFDFGEYDVSERVWKNLMALKAKKISYFPNVGDSGFAALIDDTEDCRADDEDFMNFFSQAMEKKCLYPRKGDTMKTLAHCSWMVFLHEE